jgi:DNA-binding MarR family transcriptional regulator
MQGITAPLYSKEIDLDLMTFVERYATNLTRWDVLVYFGKHPEASENVESIARHVGRRAGVVVKELDDLTYLGILAAQQNGHGMVYELARRQELQRTVVRLAQYYDQRV